MEWRGDSTVVKVEGFGDIFLNENPEVILRVGSTTIERLEIRTEAVEKMFDGKKDAWHPAQKDGGLTSEEAFLVSSGKARLNSFDEFEMVEEEGKESPASPDDQL